MTTWTRTFDCPWCGAISPVPADHIGEHFACPECKEETKLTDRNTTELPPTAPPPDAPHLSGDRTFDCPWCGAISGVASSHVGERFFCPECGKETRLTPLNTRRAPVTAPPPEAPHEEAPAGGRMGLFVLVALVLIGGGVWLALRQGEEEGTKPSSAREGTPSASTTPAVQPTPAPTEPTPAGPVPPPTAPTPAPALPPTPPPTPPVAPPPPPDPELVKAQAALADAGRALADATGWQERATAAVEAWKKEHPGALEALAALPALEDASAEVARLRADKALFPDPEKPTVVQVRAYDTAVAQSLASTPARAQVAQRVFEWMRQDLGGREVVGLAEWKQVNFHGDGFRRGLARILDGAKAVAAPLPADLAESEASARRAVEEAQKAVDAAQARVTSLSAPKK